MSPQLLLVSAAIAAEVHDEAAAFVTEEPSVLIPALLLVAFMVIGLAAVWGGVYLAMRWRTGKPQAVSEKRSLLERLSGVHTLAAGDVAQLKALAAESAVPDAAWVLIDPRVLEALARAQPDRADWARRLGERVFGEAFALPADESRGVG